MIKYKTREEIELMRESAQLVSKTLGMLAPKIVPGAIPLELDKMAEEFIRDHGGEPGFLGMYTGFQIACVCLQMLKSFMVYRKKTHSRR